MEWSWLWNSYLWKVCCLGDYLQSLSIAIPCRCNLLYGNCTGPDVCTCIAGHFGYDCSKPCTCKNGQCSDGTPTNLSLSSSIQSLSLPSLGQTGNGACSSCDSGWAGANCDVSIPLVVVPTVILALGLLIGIIIFIIWYMRRWVVVLV